MAHSIIDSMELVSEHLANQLATASPRFIIAGIFVLIAAVGFLARWAAGGSLRHIPKIKSDKSWIATRSDFTAHGVEIIEKGFRQVKSGVFRTTSLDGSDLVLLTPEHWLSLCKKKDNEIAPAREEFFRCDLHGAPFEDPYLYTYLYARMPGFERNVDTISKALDTAMAATFPSAFGLWTPTRMQPAILHVYSHVIWQVILGDSLFNPEMVEIFETYSATLIPTMKKLKAQLPIVARMTAAFSQDVKRVNLQLARAIRFLTPILETSVGIVEKIEEAGHEIDTHSGNEWFIQLVKQAPVERRRDFKYLTNILIGFAFTFVFSPGPSTTQVVYEFAFRPDYVADMRKEAADVLGSNPDEWALSKESLRSLTLLDSFCKETHKHHPTAASNLMKKIHKTQTLSNGVVLPSNTLFEVVMTAAHLANPAFDQASVWDGRRYHNLRQKMAQTASTSVSSLPAANKYEWGAATRDDVNFGYASHMCPGRWAGCAIAKMFLIKLMTRWEVRPEFGESARYKDFHSGQYILPNPTKDILLMPRKNAELS